MKRILCDIFLFIFLFYCPWYVTAVAIVLFAVVFPKYWEGVAVALIMDSFYSLSAMSLKFGFGVFVFPAIALVLLSSAVRSKIRVFA